MKRHAFLALAAAVFSLSLSASGQQAHAGENRLLERGFWTTAAVDEVAAAVAGGADIRERDVDGWTPLHWAALLSDAAAAELLLDEGAEVHARDKEGWTPLHVAAWSGEIPEMLGVLLRREADVNAVTAEGNTPLHWAVKSNDSPEVVRILLRYGPDLDAANAVGDTPLHMAAHHDATPETAALLLEGGADPAAVNKYGMTPADVTVFNTRGGAVVDLLKRHAEQQDQ